MDCGNDRIPTRIITGRNLDYNGCPRSRSLVARAARLSEHPERPTSLDVRIDTRSASSALLSAHHDFRVDGLAIRRERSIARTRRMMVQSRIACGLDIAEIERG